MPMPMCFVMKTCNFKDRIKAKKIHCVSEFNQSQWLKPYVKFNTKNRIEAEKKWWQRWNSVTQTNEQFCVW